MQVSFSSPSSNSTKNETAFFDRLPQLQKVSFPLSESTFDRLVALEKVKPPELRKIVFEFLNKLLILIECKEHVGGSGFHSLDDKLRDLVSLSIPEFKNLLALALDFSNQCQTSYREKIVAFIERKINLLDSSKPDENLGEGIVPKIIFMALPIIALSAAIYAVLKGGIVSPFIYHPSKGAQLVERFVQKDPDLSSSELRALAKNREGIMSLILREADLTIRANDDPHRSLLTYAVESGADNENFMEVVELLLRAPNGKSNCKWSSANLKDAISSLLADNQFEFLKMALDQKWIVPSDINELDRADLWNKFKDHNDACKILKNLGK